MIINLHRSTLPVSLAYSVRMGLRVCYLLMALWPMAPVCAQDMHFERLFSDTEASGHGVGAIRVITQDRHGFIWLGGENGLARYDGVRLKRYRHDSSIPNSLSSSYIRDIQIDQDHVMWIATDRGLCRYNEKTDDFTVFLAGQGAAGISDDVVTSLTLDADNNLYLGTNNGLNRLDASRERFDHYYLDPSVKGDTGINRIQDVFVDSRQNIWLGTVELGLVLFNAQSADYIYYQHHSDNPQSDSILSLAEDDQGRLWLGTYGGGVIRLSANGKEFTSYLADPSDPYAIGSNTVWDIYQDSEGVVWLGTDAGGIARYDENIDGFIHHRHSPYQLDSLSSNVVRAIFEDRQSDLWIGTFPSGINFYNRASRSFKNYTHRPDDANSLSHNSILRFYQGADGIIWIGTEGGLDAFDKTAGTIRRHNIRPGQQGSLQANPVLAIEEDPSGDLWVGTWSGGLHRYDRESGLFHHYFPDRIQNGTINSAFVWAALRDSKDNLWFGTETGGLNLYQPQTDSFAAYVHDPLDETSISSNFIWALLEDRTDRFWVGTMHGLDLFDRAAGTFIRQNALYDSATFARIIRIRSLAEDSLGRLWIGTQDNGAFIFSPDADETDSLIEVTGLPSTYVSSMVEDDYGYMWLTTDNGVARVALSGLDAITLKRSHGLIGNNFNRDATLKDRDGTIYLGSTDGFSMLDPGSFQVSAEDFPVLITDLRISNQRVEIGAPGSPLASSILTSDQIVLDYTHSMFTLEYAALSFRHSARNQYHYKLQGFDRSWNEVGTETAATYTNLGPGRYTFLVRAMSGDGIWSDTVASKVLVVLPPPWRTLWAYILYGMLALLVIAAAVRVKMKRMELRNQRALNIELLRVNKIKDTFLANTSHELRTPLNGIIGIAESVADHPLVRASDHLFHRLNLIVFSGKRLASLINDILDYSKLSASNLELFCNPIDLRALTDDVFQLLAPLCDAKQMELENAVDARLPPAYADENRLQQIMINLVGNAIKYADGGRVKVSAAQLNGRLEVTVEDSGRGIPEAQQQIIFEAFHQVEGADSRRHGGTGLGLTVTRQLVELHGGEIRVESVVGRGSKFSFSLPISETGLLCSAREADPKPSASAPIPKQSCRISLRKTAGTTVDDLRLPPAPANAHQFTVLIVDDDPVNRLVLSSVLELHHYQVVEMSDGPSALAYLASDNAVDLVILDVMMPNMSGYDVCKTIRKRHSLFELPVFFLTAKKVDESIVKAFAVGANDILCKPLSKYELLPRVANQLTLVARYQGRTPP